jgi:hypothetical protein
VDAHTLVQCLSVKCKSKCLSMHFIVCVCVCQMCGVNKCVAPSSDMSRRFSTHQGISAEPTSVSTHTHTTRRARGEEERRHVSAFM